MAMSYLQQLQAAKKARDARIALAAMRVQQQAKAAEAAPEIEQDNLPRVRFLLSRPLAVIVSVEPFGPYKPGAPVAKPAKPRGSHGRFAARMDAYRYAVLAKALRDEILAKHKVGIKDFEGEARYKAANEARQEVMWALHTKTNWDWGRIARFCGRSDHSTAIHGARAHVKRMALAGVNKLNKSPAEVKSGVESNSPKSRA